MNKMERTLAAEVRGVEEGHHAFLAGGKIRVKSDSTEGLNWLVTATANNVDGGLILFRCSPDNPRLAHGHGHRPGYCTDQGALPCKHAGVAARRLEREGLIRFAHGDGEQGTTGWVVTAKAAELVTQSYNLPADPFQGLPR